MGYCDWPATIPAKYTAEWAKFDEGVRERAIALAGRILWTLTGQVYGLCEATARPCFAPLQGTTYRGEGGFWPGLLNGAPGATGPCGCSADCTEVSYDRVALPGPVDSILSVHVDGELTAPTLYRVDKRRWLHRIDGQRWPTHQDVHAPDEAPGAFAVRYMRGLPIPAPGEELAGVLAVELARGMTGGACRLPNRATSASRQGVSVELVDPREWMTNGMTGVEEVDLWIMAVNPGRSRRPARVTSPDHRGGVLR